MPMSVACPVTICLPGLTADSRGGSGRVAPKIGVGSVTAASLISCVESFGLDGTVEAAMFAVFTAVVISDVPAFNGVVWPGDILLLLAVLSAVSEFIPNERRKRSIDYLLRWFTDSVRKGSDPSSQCILSHRLPWLTKQSAHRSQIPSAACPS